MIDAIAVRLKALGHPQRLRLFELIRAGCYCCYVASGDGRVELGSRVGDLAQEFKLAPSTVSHHLKELRTAGLIEVERRGQFLFCRVREDALAELVDFLRAETAETTSPLSASRIKEKRE